MTGSVAEGEDVVQDALARAYYELSQLNEVPALRAWLFRIARNRALDTLHRYERVQRIEPLQLALGSDTLDLHTGAVALFVERARAADHRFQGSA